MSFSKRQHLEQNIAALRLAFYLGKWGRHATETEKQYLMRYSGFGGLKFVLNRVDGPDAINQWAKSEQDLFPLTQQLHQLLHDNTTDEKEYRRYVDSMRSSVLTAFYTPPPVINAISETLRKSGIGIQKFLEPSAGIGPFMESFAD